MIRINLLGTAREKPKAKALPFQGGQPITILSSLLLLAAAAGIVWWYFSLQAESTQLDADIVQARQETARLDSVLKQVTQFEQRKATIEQRVALIEQLRKGQTGPVVMLDSVSRSLPDLLWLTELRQKGNDVMIDGRAASLTAVSDFVAHLESSGSFARPIDITTTLEPQPTGDLIRFSLKAVFTPPGT
jgi:type IV pilus assembly protein PilN